MTMDVVASAPALRRDTLRDWIIRNPTIGPSKAAAITGASRQRINDLHNRLRLEGILPPKQMPARDSRATRSTLAWAQKNLLGQTTAGLFALPPTTGRFTVVFDSLRCAAGTLHPEQEIAPGQCAWIFGDGPFKANGNWRRCCDEKMPGRSYCDVHMKQAYRPPPDPSQPREPIISQILRRKDLGR